MKWVTRNIDPNYVQDLLERVPRACISFACDHGPQAQPIVLVWHDGRYLAGIPLAADRCPSSGQEVVLLIDEGVYFFGSGYLENDSSESQCCSQKALLLFHHSFVDHYLEAYVCSVKQHWKDDVLKSYNSSREAIYLIGHRDFSPCERMLNQKRAQLHRRELRGSDPTQTGHAAMGCSPSSGRGAGTPSQRQTRV